MKLKKFILSFVFMFFGTLVIAPVYAAAPTPGKPGNQLGFNVADIINIDIDDPVLKEQLQAFGLSDSELQEVKAAQQQLKALKPNELEQLQSSFDAAFAELSTLTPEEIEHLKDANEEEIESFMRKRFEMAPELPTPAPEPKEVKKPVIPKINTKQQKALDLIETIAHGTDLFLVKLSTIPQFPITFEKWEKAGKTRLGMTWTALKEKLELLVQQLRALTSRNPKTSEYYYLEEFIKNESLINNLEKMKSVIMMYEPQVEEVEPMLGSMLSEKSKKAIQKLLNQYIEALTVLKVPDALNTVIATFEPIAKKLREEEAKVRKKAEEESRQPRFAKRKIEAGFPGEDELLYAPPIYPVPTYKDVPASRTAPLTSPTGSAFTDAKGGTPAAPSPTDKGKPSARVDKDKKEPVVGNGKPGKPSLGKPPVVPDKGVMDAKQKEFAEKVEPLLGLIKDHLEDANKVVKKHKPLVSLKRHLLDESELDASLINEGFSSLVSKLNVATDYILDAKKRLEGLNAAEGIRSQIKGKIGLTFKSQKELERLFKDFEDIAKNREQIVPQVARIKRHAYFGEPLKQSPEIIAQIFNREEIEKLEKYNQAQDAQSAAKLIHAKVRDKLDPKTLAQARTLRDQGRHEEEIKVMFEALREVEEKGIASLQKTLAEKKIEKSGSLVAAMESALKFKDAVETFDKEKKPEVVKREVAPRISGI